MADYHQKSLAVEFLTALLEHINHPGWCDALCGARSRQALEEVLEDFL